MKARLAEQLGDESQVIRYGGKRVTYTMRNKPKSLDVASLMRAGVPEAAYANLVPSVVKFRSWAAKEDWDPATVNEYLIDNPEPASPSIGVKDDISQEDEDD